MLSRKNTESDPCKIRVNRALCVIGMASVVGSSQLHFLGIKSYTCVFNCGGGGGALSPMFFKGSTVVYSQIGIDVMVSSEMRVCTGFNFFNEKL